MKKLHPDFIYNEEGKKVGVAFSPKDFEKIREELEDYHDYQLVKKIGGRHGKLSTFEEVFGRLEKRALSKKS